MKTAWFGWWDDERWMRLEIFWCKQKRICSNIILAQQCLQKSSSHLIIETKISFLFFPDSILIDLIYVNGWSNAGITLAVLLQEHTGLKCCSQSNNCTAVPGYVTPLSLYVYTCCVCGWGKAWKLRNRKKWCNGPLWGF